MYVTLEVNGQTFPYHGPEAFINAVKDDAELYGGKGVITLISE